MTLNTFQLSPMSQADRKLMWIRAMLALALLALASATSCRTIEGAYSYEGIVRAQTWRTNGF